MLIIFIYVSLSMEGYHLGQLNCLSAKNVMRSFNSHFFLCEIHSEKTTHM
jgi:hypothetical protein